MSTLKLYIQKVNIKENKMETTFNILGVKVKESSLIKVVRGIRYSLEGTTLLSLLLVIGFAFHN